MKALLGFLWTTLLGGVLFLLPVGIVIVVFGKLLAIAERVGRAFHDVLLPNSQSPLLVLVVAIVILVLIALIAGGFARTSMGRSVFVWLEDSILSRLPVYAIFRQMIADLSGSVDRIVGQKDLRVVSVRLDDQVQIGFVVDEHSDEQVVVYFPGAPSALSGTVALVERSRVSDTNLTAPQVLAAMRRLGAGIVERAREADRLSAKGAGSGQSSGGPG